MSAKREPKVPGAQDREGQEQDLQKDRKQPDRIFASVSQVAAHEEQGEKNGGSPEADGSSQREQRIAEEGEIFANAVDRRDDGP